MQEPPLVLAKEKATSSPQRSHAFTSFTVHLNLSYSREFSWKMVEGAPAPWRRYGTMTLQAVHVETLAEGQ